MTTRAPFVVAALAGLTACAPSIDDTADTSELGCTMPGDCPLLAPTQVVKIGEPSDGYDVITDLTVFRDRLFVTSSVNPLGEFGAAVQATADGERFDTVIDDPTSQGFLRLRVIGDALYAPDGDPDGYDPSWVYRSSDGATFERAAVTGSVHTFDVAEYEGELLASNGMISGQGSLCRSEDGTGTWSEVASTPYSRLKQMVVFDGRLFVAKRVVRGPVDYVVWDGKVSENNGLAVDAVAGEAVTWRWHATSYGRLFWAGGTDRVWTYTTVDGETWNEVTTLEGEFVSDFAELDGNLYALGHRGIYASSDGETFERILAFEDTERFGPVSSGTGINVEATASMEAWNGALWLGSSQDGGLYRVE